MRESNSGHPVEFVGWAGNDEDHLHGSAQAAVRSADRGARGGRLPQRVFGRLLEKYQRHFAR